MSNSDKTSKQKILQTYSNSFPNIFSKINTTLIPMNKSIERNITIKKPSGLLLSILRKLNRSPSSEEFTLIPDFIDSSLNLSKRIYSSDETASGAFGKVYLKYYKKNNKTKTLKQNIIFKEIKNKNTNEYEYNGLIFHYLLYCYYKNFPEKIQFLCKIHEIGRIKNNDKLYAIMDYCGNDLTELEIIKTISNKNEGLFFIVKIFKKILESVKLIHDLNYLHLDIKLDNFLISGNKYNFQLKIIDFGLVTECNKTVKDCFGTSRYLANDWVKNYYNGKETTLKKHHDIFSIGCTFMYLIFIFFNQYIDLEIPIFICPLLYHKIERNLLLIRSNYGIKEHFLDIEVLKYYFRRASISDNIANQICSMISDFTNPNPPPNINDISTEDTQTGYRTHVINNVTLKRVQDIIDNLSKLQVVNKSPRALPV